MWKYMEHFNHFIIRAVYFYPPFAVVAVRPQTLIAQSGETHLWAMNSVNSLKLPMEWKNWNHDLSGMNFLFAQYDEYTFQKKTPNKTKI